MYGGRWKGDVTMKDACQAQKSPRVDPGRGYRNEPEVERSDTSGHPAPPGRGTPGGVRDSADLQSDVGRLCGRANLCVSRSRVRGSVETRPHGSVRPVDQDSIGVPLPWATKRGIMIQTICRPIGSVLEWPTPSGRLGRSLALPER